MIMMCTDVYIYIYRLVVIIKEIKTFLFLLDQRLRYLISIWAYSSKAICSIYFTSPLIINYIFLRLVRKGDSQRG